MAPPVPTLSQSCFAARQDVLQAWLWGIADWAVFFSAVPLSQVAGTGEGVVGGLDEEA